MYRSHVFLFDHTRIQPMYIDYGGILFTRIPAPTSISPQMARCSSHCPPLTDTNYNAQSPCTSPLIRLFSSSLVCSQSSDSDASFSASSTALSGPTLRPASVVDRESKIAWPHRASAKRSRILNRLFPLPVSYHSTAHRIFWAFQWGQFLKRYSRV